VPSARLRFLRGVVSVLLVVWLGIVLIEWLTPTLLNRLSAWIVGG